MANVSHRAPDIAEHPDMVEMRARYARILDGGQAVAVDGLVLLTGLYLAISPWVVGFTGTAPRLAAGNLILGIAVAVIGLALAQAPLVMYRLSWAMVGIGGWTVIAPWATSSAYDNSRAVLNNVVAGAVTILLGLCAVAMLMSAGRQPRA
jgi:SPW repeat